MVRKLLAYLAENSFTWFFLQPFARAGTFMMQARNRKYWQKEQQKQQAHYEKVFHKIISARTVLHGPFKGLRYPALLSSGSALYPKLIGSYEREIHGVLEKICNTNYSQVINIGCAEGYYAVGLALRIPDATIYAYDIDKAARRLTTEMARLNEVENRVKIGEACTNKILLTFPFSKKALIVCDCEGYENSLFDYAVIRNLTTCDLLIETHDFIEIETSMRLTNLFSSTHHVEAIKSIDDIEKSKTYNYEEAAGFDQATRKYLFREGRPAIMEWLFLTPKQNA
jgi:precorrin-6B methylase 2